MKRIFLFLFLIVNYINADLVDIYRNQGIDAVVQKLENEMTKKEYWENYLANKNVDFGYYESKKFVILAQKNKKELYLYKVNKNDYDLVLKDNVILGGNEGDKYLEGDLRTPEGAYDLTKKLTKLDEFYGPLALVTSYPNTFDKALNKKGHGIWIHGMPLNENREDFTKGCIALENPKLKELDSKIDLTKSVLLISENNLKKVSKEQISTILASIYRWKDAWKKSDINKYLEFYAKSFRKHNGMDLDSFKKYKTRIFSKNEKKSINFKNINILPYPNSLNKLMFRVVMDEDYETRFYSFVGKKELYIELKDDKIKILAEG